MKLIISALVILSLAACKKDKPDCEENNYGWLRFSVPNTGKWDLYIDGVHVAQVGGYKTTIKDLSASAHTVKYVNVQKTDSSQEVINIPQCDSVLRYK